jgi:hypothetical protein
MSTKELERESDTPLSFEGMHSSEKSLTARPIASTGRMPRIHTIPFPAPIDFRTHISHNCLGRLTSQRDVSSDFARRTCKFGASERHGQGRVLWEFARVLLLATRFAVARLALENWFRRRPTCPDSMSQLLFSFPSRVSEA